MKWMSSTRTPFPTSLPRQIPQFGDRTTMLRAARQLTPLRRAARPVHTEARIAELGYVLPQLPQPAGAYSLGIHAGGWVYLAGHLPFQEDMKSVHVGRIGAEFTPEEGTELAQTAPESTIYRQSSW